MHSEYRTDKTTYTMRDHAVQFVLTVILRRWFIVAVTCQVHGDT